MDRFGWVRCRCYEDHRLNPGPVPYEDLYINDEGRLSSRKLDEAKKKLDHQSFRTRYGELELAFEEWLLSEACEHSYGRYCFDWFEEGLFGNGFGELVEACGGEAAFPALSKVVPNSFEGSFPAELAEQALAELDRFVERLGENRYTGPIRNLLVASMETGNPIHWV